MAKPKARKSFIAALEKADLKDIELAVKLGVTPQSVRNWREGTITPGGPTRIALASVLDYPLPTVEDWFGVRRRSA